MKKETHLRIQNAVVVLCVVLVVPFLVEGMFLRMVVAGLGAVVLVYGINYLRSRR